MPVKPIRSNRKSFRRLLVWFALIGLLVHLPACAGTYEEPTPVLFEKSCKFQVNKSQYYGSAVHSVAMDAEGNFVFVYPSESVLFQRFDRKGGRIGPEQQVNTTPISAQASELHPQIGMTPIGEFVVVWRNHIEQEQTSVIQAQRFLANGEKRGNEFRIAEGLLSGYQMDLAINTSGAFVVTWLTFEQQTVFARAYDPDGIALSDVITVNSNVEFDKDLPKIAMDESGRFVVVWVEEEDRQLPHILRGRLFASDGAAETEPFQINEETVDNFKSWSVGMSGDGNFVVAWHPDAHDQPFIFGQRFDSMGKRIDDPFPVNTTSRSTRSYVNITMMPGGDFLVVWQGDPPPQEKSVGSGGGSQPMNDYYEYGIYARRFSNDATPYEGEFSAESGTVFNLYGYFAAAVSENWSFVVTWLVDSDFFASLFSPYADPECVEPQT